MNEMNSYSKPKPTKIIGQKPNQTSPFNSTSPWDNLFKIDHHNTTPGPGYYEGYLNQ